MLHLGSDGLLSMSAATCNSCPRERRYLVLYVNQGLHGLAGAVAKLQEIVVVAVKVS